MADYKLDIQSWSGGESDSPYRGNTGTVAKTKSVEVRKNLEGFYIENDVVDTGWNISGDIIYMESLETLGVKNGGVIVCTDTGRIYLDGVLKQTINTGTDAHNKVLGVGVLTNNTGVQYVYYITDASFGNFEIHRSTTDLNTFNIGLKELSTDAAYSKVYTYNDINRLYMGVGNRVFVMDNLEIVTNDFSLMEQEVIVGLTQYLGSYRVYCNKGRTGVQYLWDGIFTNPQSRQEWKNLPIRAVVNDGATDYMITGASDAYSDLWIVQGTQKIKVKANLEGKTQGRVFQEYISIRENLVYMSGRNEDDFGVYTYGDYFPGTPGSLVYSYNLPDAVLHHAHEIAFSYFACNDGKVYKVSHTHKSTPESFGEVETIVFEGDGLEKMKLDEIRTSFDTNGGSIEIYARTDINSTYNLLYTIPNTQDRRYKIYYNMIKSNYELGNFEEIQFKIKLIGGASSPMQKRFLVLFSKVQ